MEVIFGIIVLTALASLSAAYKINSVLKNKRRKENGKFQSAETNQFHPIDPELDEYGPNNGPLK